MGLGMSPVELIWIFIMGFFGTVLAGIFWELFRMPLMGLLDLLLENCSERI